MSGDTGFMCWGNNKNFGKIMVQASGSHPEIDTMVMVGVFAKQRQKSVDVKMEMNKEKGLCAGCEVRMLKTGRKRIIDHISEDGSLFMVGARIPCSHTDCELVQDAM